MRSHGVMGPLSPVDAPAADGAPDGARAEAARDLSADLPVNVDLAERHRSVPFSSENG
jgi:hypothetical protein